jgi:hypothetical protein
VKLLELTNGDYISRNMFAGEKSLCMRMRRLIGLPIILDAAPTLLLCPCGKDWTAFIALNHSMMTGERLEGLQVDRVVRAPELKPGLI